MKNRQSDRRRLLKQAGALGVLGALGSSVPVHAEMADTPHEAVIGSWLVAVRYATGTGHTRGLATFTGDGGFVGSISAYETAPVNPTPSRGTTLHGSWLRTGRRKYAVTALRLHLDERGTLLGIMKTNISLAVDRSSDVWSGNFAFVAMDPNGVVFRSDTGRLHARRIGVDLP